MSCSKRYLSFFELIAASFQQVAVVKTRASLNGTSLIEHSEMAIHPDPNLAHGEEEKVQDMHPTSTLKVCGREQGRRTVIRTTSRAKIYQGFFGQIYVKKKTTYLSGKQEGATPIGEEAVYLLHPSFLRAVIEIHQVGIGGKISRSLRYCPTLPNDFGIFEICRSGDMEGFRQALTRQEVPIHAQMEDGDSLLHLACMNGSLELCSLLIELGVDVSHEDNFGRKAFQIFSNYPRKSDHCVEAMVRLLILGQEHVEEHDISNFLEVYWGPPDGIEWLLSTDFYLKGLDLIRGQLLHRVMGLFARDPPLWTNLVRKIVRQAEDLHCPHIDSEDASPIMYTLLDSLFGMTWDPIEGAQVSEAWLEALAMEGVDVREFLKVEMELHGENYTPPSQWDNIPQRFLVFDIGQKPSVEWDWWIDPDGPASLVCHEFRHMACSYTEGYLLPGYYTWEHAWPFINPEWAHHLGWWSPDSAEHRLWRHMIDLADSRAARRVAKREAKIARAEGTYRRKRMPGSWID